jgi:hypothetical protein
MLTQILPEKECIMEIDAMFPSENDNGDWWNRTFTHFDLIPYSKRLSSVLS